MPRAWGTKSLQGSRVAAFALCLLAGIAVLLLAFQPAAAAKARPGKISDPATLVAKQTNDLHRILAQARKRLRNLAHLPSVLAADGPACSADMAALPPMSRYGSSGAADARGNIFCLGIPSSSPVNIADRAYFLRAIGTRNLGVGDFQLGRVTGLGSIGLGFPTIVNGRVTGIVLTVLSLDWLERRIANRRPRGALDVLVIDDHGTVLARAGRQPTRPGTNVGGSALVKAMLDRGQGEGTFRLGKRRVRTAFDVVPLSADNIRVAVSVAR